jgi:hypothetical protein
MVPVDRLYPTALKPISPLGIGSVALGEKKESVGKGAYGTVVVVVDGVVEPPVAVQSRHQLAHTSLYAL